MQKGVAPILIVLIAAAVGGYFVYTNYQTKAPAPAAQPTTYSTPQPSPSTTESTTSAETANWKTYTNTKVSYSIKYPEYLVLEEVIAPAASPDYSEVFGTVVLDNPSVDNHFDINITVGKTTKKFVLDNLLGNGPQLSYINDFLKDKKISKILVDGNEVIMVQDIAVGPGDGLVTDLMMIRGDLVYQVTLFNSSNENNELFNQILSTFRFE